MPVVNTYWGDEVEPYEPPEYDENEISEELSNKLLNGGFDLSALEGFSFNAGGGILGEAINDPNSLIYHDKFRQGSGMDNAVDVGYMNHTYIGEDGLRYKMVVSWDEERQALKYEEYDERVYRWQPSDEHKRTHRDAATAESAYGKEFTGGTGAGWYTEAEIREAWDADDMRQMQEQGVSWDQYWGYVTGIDTLINEGKLPDYSSMDPRELKALQDSGEYVSWGDVPEYMALVEGLGIPTQFSDRGDVYNFNGFGYSRDYWSDKSDGEAIIKGIASIAIGAATAGTLGPALGLGGGFAGGATSAAIGSAIGQAAVNGGKIDPTSVLIAGLTGGIKGFFGDMVGGHVNVGSPEWVKRLDTFIWDMSDKLGIDYSQLSSIMEQVATGLVNGEDVDEIIAGALVGVGTDKLTNYLSGKYPDGFDIKNWFREGDTNISTEAINGLLRDGIDALVSGGMDETEAFMTMFGYFQDGGSLDFILPALGDMDLSGFDIDLSGFGDPCAEGSPISWACGLDPNLPEFAGLSGILGSIDWPDVDIPSPCGEGWTLNDLGECVPELPDIPSPCGEGFSLNDLGECVPDLPDVKCPEGWDVDEDGVCIEPPTVCGEGYSWDPELKECVPEIPDVKCPEGWDVDEDGVCIEPPSVCGEGYSWDPELKECVPDVDITCPEGFQRDDLTGECVEIEVPDIKCPEGWDVDEDGVCIEPPTACGEGYSWDPQLGKCIPDREPSDTCPVGYKKDENGECVKIEGPDTPDPDPDLPPLAEASGGMFDTSWTNLQWGMPQYQGPQQAKLTPYQTILNSLKRDKGMFS